jgi:hypothetical protein
MTRPLSDSCNLHWRELLTPQEIENWVRTHQIPRRFSSELACPGVYRFIFPEVIDKNVSHTPCYVGEAGKIGMRLRDHFRPRRNGTDCDKGWETRGLRAGWSIRGSIQNSMGVFTLQMLTIEGPINFCGLTIEPNSISNPFENSFLRKMLENWAILASEYADHMLPLNRRGTPNIFREMLRNARKSAS